MSAPAFALRGIYFHDGFLVDPPRHAPLTWDLAQWTAQLRWLRACGLNAVEFATMLEFNRRPSTPLEHRKIADRLRLLDLAHAMDMQFGYLLSNTVLSTVPAGEEPGDQLGDRAQVLCPRQPGNFERTLEIPLFYQETYREADFFEEFAADWGGCTCGQCGVPEFRRYVEALSANLEALNPQARLYANTWCISYWGKDPLAEGWKGVFEREISGTRELIAALPSLPANTHLALPCHHLYRALAFSEYGSRAQPPVFPTTADLQPVLQAGRQVLAWPHFVMDDDAYRPLAWGVVHTEVRYLRALIQTLAATGISQVVGNLYLPLLQLPNTFAFARLCQDPGLDPTGILAEFARLLAHPADRALLAEVLAWVENHSYWQQQLPADARLPLLPCSLSDPQVEAAAAAIRPNPASDLPLPCPAGLWLEDLRRSLPRLAQIP
ncbi:MAG: hypothetical protein IT369_19980 [Candidatus Latescibacteria bacterium]|nr:hypothetical protein [Candidatus Latescibacterota bacterium]